MARTTTTYKTTERNAKLRLDFQSETLQRQGVVRIKTAWLSTPTFGGPSEPIEGLKERTVVVAEGIPFHLIGETAKLTDDTGEVWYVFSPNGRQLVNTQAPDA